MEEEKKEQKQEPKPEQKPIEKKEEKKKQVEPHKRVKTSNCAKCGKLLKKRNWYYRAGKYYCNKGCWKAANQKSAQKEETK